MTTRQQLIDTVLAKRKAAAREDEARAAMLKAYAEFKAHRNEQAAAAAEVRRLELVQAEQERSLNTNQESEE